MASAPRGLPAAPIDPLKEQLDQLSEMETSWRRIELIESLRRRLPEVWEKHRSQLVAATSSWEAHRGQQIAAEKEEEKRRLSQLNSELKRKLDDADGRRRLATRDREAVESEIASSFTSTWGVTADLLRGADGTAPVAFTYSPAQAAPSNAKPVEEWKLKSPVWLMQSSIAALLVNKGITFGLPSVAAATVLVALLPIVFHPSPGFGPAFALTLAILTLFGFFRYRPAIKARVAAAAAGSMALANQAAHELRTIEAAAHADIDSLVAEVRGAHSANIEALSGATKSKLAAIEASSSAYYREIDVALQESVRRIRSIDLNLQRLVAKERSSPACVASDFSEGAVPLVSGRTTARERLHIRFAMSEFDEVQPSLPGDVMNSLRLSMPLPKVICERLLVPYLWAGDSKKSLMLHDPFPAANGFDRISELITLRLLRQIDPGKLLFTLFDPIGLGGTFSGILKLSDYDDALIAGRVWSNRDHIRRQLKDLIEHIEIVIQRYLRDDFEDIEQYNDSAGVIAEAYRFLFIADFPDGFDEESSKDLLRVLRSGPRCGVFAIVHVNDSRKWPHGVDPASLHPFATVVERSKNGDLYRAPSMCGDGVQSSATSFVRVDDAPPAEFVRAVVEQFGESSVAAKLVEVPYRKIVSGSDWTKSTSEGISAPLGPSGARKIQFLELGKATSHHVLIVGRPGSGKSNLIHVFIAAMAQTYSPRELNLYLVDFKKGVEFKCYADSKLPHARVIAIESEREFGLNVLEALNAELTRRGELFRSHSVSSLAEYRKRTQQIMPRVVLIIDEFQELFSVEDRLKREAGQLMDRLVRQGRAFGLHLVLATQSLANAGLDRSTQDQMAVRIALQCSEADSRLILAQENIAARRLSRPGEAIYNDAVGLIEGNRPFQAALFSDLDRESVLQSISAQAEQAGMVNEGLVVFEGHNAAQIGQSRVLMESLIAPPPARLASLQLWLGEPIALKPTHMIDLKRQSAHNLLLLSRDEQEALGLVSAMLLSTMAASARGQCRIHVVDLGAAGSPESDLFRAYSGCGTHEITVHERRSLAGTFSRLCNDIDGRIAEGEAVGPPVIMILFGLQRARDLRDAGGYTTGADRTGEVNPAKLLAKILRDGPDVGVHTVIWCDTYANLDRTLGRGVLRDIAFRIAGPLAAQESQQIFGDHGASQINRAHRLLSYDDEKVGVFEMFRPFAAPSAESLDGYLRLLQRRNARASNDDLKHEWIQ